VKHLESIPSLIHSNLQFSLRGSNCRYSLSIGPDLPEIDVDPIQFGQVMTNLVLNSIQAMPDGALIQISISNTNILLGNIYSLRPGPYLTISIIDEGTGIPETIKDRLFEPYISTKAKGNGLGLATAYSIIKRHNGTLTCRDHQPRGTEFQIYLPVIQTKEPRPKIETSKVSLPTMKVLIMDDQAEVHSALGKILQSLKMTCVSSFEGRDAIQQYFTAKDHREPFDLVIMDLIVPDGLGGIKTTEEIIARDPDSVIIASTGYTNDDVVANFTKYGFRGVLKKPYTRDGVIQALHHALSNKNF